MPSYQPDFFAVGVKDEPASLMKMHEKTDACSSEKVLGGCILKDAFGQGFGVALLGRVT